MASMKQWFGETVHSAKQMMGAAEVESTPEDLAFNDEYAYVCGLEPQMRNVLKHTTLLVQRQREQGAALDEVSSAFSALGQSEGDAEVLGQALAALGITAQQLAAIATEQVENEQQYFEEPLTDYLQLVGAARRALEKRSEKQLTLNTAKASLDAKRQSHTRLVERSAAGREDRVRASEQEMRKAEQQLLQTSEEAQLVTARVMDEMERFKREKLGDFQRISLDYVQLQIEACERQEKAWETLIPKLEALDAEALEGAAGGGGAASGT
jgi:sorting nexin-1/2